MIGVGLLLFTSLHAQKDNSKDLLPKKLEALRDSASYAMGVSIGQTLVSRYGSMNADLIAKGLVDAFGTNDTLMKAEAISALLNSYTKQQPRIQLIGNRDAAERFLKENARKEGVIKTASGLQYIILKQGNGEMPLPGNKVKVNYIGTLLNGKEFENSYKRGQPEEFELTAVIKGWAEALQLMQVGSKFKLFIPAELAYGDNGDGAAITPASLLIFELELLQIVN